MVKKADKGTAVVILDAMEYLVEGLHQLRDKRYYERLPDDSTAALDAASALNGFVQRLIQLGF